MPPGRRKPKEIRLADVLRRRRHGQFVGRAFELSAFRGALERRGEAAQVLYIHGPGGIGKTALMHELAEMSRAAGRRAVYLDGHNLGSTPNGFLASLAAALGLAPGKAALDKLVSQAPRLVLLIDTSEKIAAIDGWLRDSLLPQLPARSIVCIASRLAPGPSWHTSPGWGSLLRPLALRDLEREEARALLTRRGVADARQTDILAFARGYPLALSLAADWASRRDHDGMPGKSPDLVRELLATFLEEVPDRRRRAALEACAAVRATTQPLLAHLLGVRDARPQFEWLSRLSFIESGPRGLFPHDVARDALESELSWRNPEGHRALLARATSFYAARIAAEGGPDVLQAITDFEYLCSRRSPVLARVFDWSAHSEFMVDVPAAAEHREVLAIIARHEGPASAALAARWLAVQPEGLQIVRDARGAVAGLLFTIHLDGAPPKLLRADPGAREAWRYLERRAPLRSGERATVHRFWMSRDGYQAPGPVQTIISALVPHASLSTPRLAHDFLPFADPDFWAPALAHTEIPRLAEADFEMGGRRYGVFGHDWRKRPPAEWLALVARRSGTAPPEPAPSQPLVVLSRDDFAEAVKRALREVTRPGALVANPLLRSSVVVSRNGATTVSARVPALVSLLREASAALGASASGQKRQRALQHTYLDPVPGSQEQVAERLDLPFSTYRRHLGAAIAEVTELLWQREIAR